MRIFVLTATYELRVSRKSHLRDHPIDRVNLILSHPLSDDIADTTKSINFESVAAYIYYCIVRYSIMAQV